MNWLLLTFSVGIGTTPLRKALEGILSIDPAYSKPPQPDGETGPSRGPGETTNAALSATLATLLKEPERSTPKPAETPVTPTVPGGMFMGDGLSPVPAKLVAKIQQGDFVEMGELLPEFNSLSQNDDGTT